MIYSYGCRVDNDSNAITVIDEENETAVTTGYVDGEYVEFSGGGGSSDFSTATVTIVNNVNSHVNFSIPVVYANETLESANGSFSVDPNSTAVTDVILYKGSALCPEVQSVEVPVVHMSVSGNITEGAFGSLTITGDGTITIS